MKLNDTIEKSITKIVKTSAILLFCSNTIASEYWPPVKNIYMDKFHWSSPPDLKALRALGSESKKKFFTCAAQANRSGSGAAGVYDEHFRNGDSMERLAKTLPRQDMVEGYKPVPKRELEPWTNEDSSENISKMLVKRTLDLMWGYYKDYEQPASTTDKTSVAQQVMWDYCLTIPKELFAE